VLDQRCEAGLLEQHVDERRFASEIFVHELDHHELLESRRPALERQLDLGHAAAADRRDQLVAPEPGRR
jgi:hypothetical protein